MADPPKARAGGGVAGPRVMVRGYPPGYPLGLRAENLCRADPLADLATFGAWFRATEGTGLADATAEQVEAAFTRWVAAGYPDPLPPP